MGALSTFRWRFEMTKRKAMLGALIAFGALSLAVAAQQAPDAPKVIESEKVKDNLYVITGSKTIQVEVKE